MNWVRTALSSSIGKKFVMALTGLLLCGFLVVHLGGNLLLYVGADAYNKYAHAMHEQQGLVYLAEVGLLVLFVAHIALAVITARENKAARSVSYATKATKQDGHILMVPASNMMVVTGFVVLGFLLVHLADFRFNIRLPGEPSEQPYQKAVRVLRNPLSFTVYLVGTAILGVHLWHGVQSAFQSLGISHPRYDGLIKWGGFIFAALIAAGFFSFPLWAGAYAGGGP